MSTSTAAAVLAKLAGLSVAGKATVGVVIAAGVVGVAASAPAIADQFTGSTTPPLAGITSSADPSESSEATETEKPEASETSRPLPTDLPSAAAFGQSVAADARDGGVDGQQISQRAHERNDVRKDAATPEPSDTPEATDATDTPDTPDATSTEAPAVHPDRTLPTAEPTTARH